MGDQPLSSPRHRRLGGPLPRQLANVTRANPYAINLSNSGDATSVVTGYYASFPMTIPLIRACCSRVTHPFAGRRRVLPPSLPLDLHVLRLPLAFILSQDQTLHCIFYKILSLLPTAFLKETDARLNIEKCYTFPGLACTFLVFQYCQ